MLAPSHLWLVVSYMIAAFGLLQAGVQRRAEVGAGVGARWPRPVDLPVLLALGILLRITLWSLIYIDPFTADFAAGGATVGRLDGYAGIAWENPAAQIAGTAGIVLPGVLLALFLVVPLRRLRLPGGAIATVLLYEAALTVAATGLWLALPAVAGAALAGEALWARVRRGGLGGPAGETGYWALAGVVPLVQFALYFGLLAAFGGGLIWTPHLRAWVPVVAELFGLIAALLAIPPRSVSPGAAAD